MSIVLEDSEGRSERADEEAGSLSEAQQTQPKKVELSQIEDVSQNIPEIVRLRQVNDVL